MLKNSQNEIIDLKSNQKDCDYAIFEYLTGKSIK